MKRSKKLFFISLALLVCVPFLSEAAVKKVSSSKKEEAFITKGKTKGYLGDPAKKRGFDLGYDTGMTEGKNDKKNGLKLQPFSSQQSKIAEKKFRVEYGNKGRFLDGYKLGFERGYKSGYSRVASVESNKKGSKKEVVNESKKKATVSQPSTLVTKNQPRKEVNKDQLLPILRNSPAVPQKVVDTPAPVAAPKTHSSDTSEDAL